MRKREIREKMFIAVVLNRYGSASFENIINWEAGRREFFFVDSIFTEKDSQCTILKGLFLFDLEYSPKDSIEAMRLGHAHELYLNQDSRVLKFDCLKEEDKIFVDVKIKSLAVRYYQLAEEILKFASKK